MDSTAVGIAQLAHAVDECISAVRDGDVSLPKLIWGAPVISASLYERSGNGIELSLVPSVGPHMRVVATPLIGSGCRLGW